MYSPFVVFSSGVRFALLLAGAASASGWAQTVPAIPTGEPGSGVAGMPSSAPTFLEGDRMSGHTELDAVLEGNARLTRGKTVLQADRLEYDQATDQARATGNVVVEQGGNRYSGPLLEIKVETFEGFFLSPTYQLKDSDAHGEAARADFIDQNHSVVHDASYTTCRRLPGPSWLPDWILRATTITIDNDEEVGVANDAYVYFKDAPVVPIPALSFPLTEKRKSGLLPITIDPFNSINGITVSQPYYWNIAPNRDATITPTLMTSRGVDLGVEYRYLEPGYSGKVYADYMAGDQLRMQDRWGLAWGQTARVETGNDALGTVTVDLNLNRVSDNNYWKDFSANDTVLTQRLLPGDMLASWGSGDLTGTVHVAKWQTVQASDSVIVPPYDKLPQLTLHYAPSIVNQLDWSLDGDYTAFQSDAAATGQPNAQRVFGLAQVSYPLVAAQGFVTPKLQLHTSAYQFDGALSNGDTSAGSTVPTFSLDSGLVFERSTAWLGQRYIQTLEPRAFYVYTPYRNQSVLPLYDTAAADFNFSSIYTENAYVGNDRISDNNLLTVGLSTRFLDPDTGAQAARFGIAQRLRFEQQKVTLDSTTAPAEAGWSDILLGSSINLNSKWAFDSTTQYNPLTEQSVRSTIAARYSPGEYRVLNLAHRFQRDVSEQVELSWQWPINDFWGDRGQDLGAGKGQGEGRYYTVGRVNYSIDQSAMVDTVLGLEYDAGCWLGRLVYSRTQTSTSTAVERIMFQIEFVGLSRVGIDPMSTLKQSISHYQNLRDTGASSGASQ